MNRATISDLGGTGSPCSSRPHPVPQNRHTVAGEKGVEQVEQGISILGNIETSLNLRNCMCLIDEYNANTLFHLFQGGRRSSRNAVFWNRVPCSTAGTPPQFEVMT